MPLTDDTHHIIDRDNLEKMKPGAYVINTSRGGLINEQHLQEVLAEGRLAGAGLDVLETEPPAEAPPLSRLANTVITPPAAFYSEASVVELRKKASQEIRTLREGQPFWSTGTDIHPIATGNERPSRAGRVFPENGSLGSRTASLVWLPL